LLIGLLCLGPGVGVRDEPFERLGKTHGTAAGSFRLERVEAAGDGDVTLPLVEDARFQLESLRYKGGPHVPPVARTGERGRHPGHAVL